MGDVLIQAAIMTAGFYFAPGSTLTNLKTTLQFFAVAVAVSGANYYLQQQAMRNNFSNKASGRMITQRSPIALRQVIYGTVRVGGLIAHAESTENDKFLHLIIVLASHEINAISKVYFDGEELTISTNAVTAPARYNGKAKVYTHLGTDGQAADANLVAESSSWSNAHKLSGIAYLYVRLEYDQDAFANGIPEITALVQGKKVFDPRDSSTSFKSKTIFFSF